MIEMLLVQIFIFYHNKKKIPEKVWMLQVRDETTKESWQLPLHERLFPNCWSCIYVWKTIVITTK